MWGLWRNTNSNNSGTSTTTKYQWLVGNEESFHEDSNGITLKDKPPTSRGDNTLNTVGDANSVVVGRYRITLPGGPAFPATCELFDYSGSSSSIGGAAGKKNHPKLVQDCIVGGVWWKLQQFCKQPKSSTASGGGSGNASVKSSTSSSSSSWRVRLAILGVYAICIVLFGIFVEGPMIAAPNTTSKNTSGPPSHHHQHAIGGIWVLGLGLPLLTALYIAVVGFLGNKLSWKKSQEFQSKLDNLLQELAEPMAVSGYTISQADYKEERSMLARIYYGCLSCLGSSPIYITVRKSRSSSTMTTTSLPPVTLDFYNSSSREILSRNNDLEVNVESILYGIYPPSTSSSSSAPLPIDDWLAGGLMLRLRQARYQASIRSRFFGLFILIPIGIVSILLVATGNGEHSSSSNNSQDTTSSVTASQGNDSDNVDGLHALLLSLSIGCILATFYIYVRECIDGTAIHGASRMITKQFSTLSRDRHDCAIHYEVMPGDFLPRTTKGVLRFQTLAAAETTTISTGGGDGASLKKKETSAAHIAFV